jgi:hypothetical protein
MHCPVAFLLFHSFYGNALEFTNGVKVRLQELVKGRRIENLGLSSEKPGIQEVHSSGRQASHPKSSDTSDGPLTISDEAADLNSHGRPQIRSLFGRFSR